MCQDDRPHWDIDSESVSNSLTAGVNAGFSSTYGSMGIQVGALADQLKLLYNSAENDHLKLLMRMVLLCRIQ